jgi:hypothetical protein
MFEALTGFAEADGLLWVNRRLLLVGWVKVLILL